MHPLIIVKLLLVLYSTPLLSLRSPIHKISSVLHMSSPPAEFLVPKDDPFKTYTPFERFLFGRFAAAVATETESKVPANYFELIELINKMTYTQPAADTSTMSTSMLVRLFPPGLLPAYKVLFSKFPSFSAWMNTWVINPETAHHTPFLSFYSHYNNTLQINTISFIR